MKGGEFGFRVLQTRQPYEEKLRKTKRPKNEPKYPRRELLQSELEQIIDLHLPPVRFRRCVDWASFEETLGATYHPAHGAPGGSTRLMKALHYLKVRARSERRGRGGALDGKPLLAALKQGFVPLS